MSAALWQFGENRRAGFCGTSLATNTLLYGTPASRRLLLGSSRTKIINAAAAPMNTLRRDPRVYLLALFTALAGCATQPVAPLSDSDAATIATVFFAERARSSLARDYWRREQAEWAVNCASRWDADEMGQLLVPALHQELTAKELLQARRFLATPTGQLYAERAVYRAPSAPITPRQAAELRTFAQSDVGQKLMNPATIDRMTRALASASGDKLEACRTRHASTPGPSLQQITDPRLLERNLGEIACSKPSPSYPREAIRGDQTGQVTVRFWINPRGLVFMTLVVKSSRVPSLDAAAEKAMQAMRCDPFIQDGKAISVTATQPINFELR